MENQETKYYVNIENNKLNGTSELNNALNWNDNYFQIEITKEIYDSINENPDRFVYLEGEVVENPEYEMLELQKEKERIAKLNLTAADVERAIYKARGMDFEDILALVENNPEIDLKALKIELKANNFYRGNPYISRIGELLGFSEGQLDEFFEGGDYMKLVDRGNNNA